MNKHLCLALSALLVGDNVEFRECFDHPIIDPTMKAGGVHKEQSRFVIARLAPLPIRKLNTGDLYEVEFGFSNAR